MDAFIGWSSQRGLKMAEALRAWLSAGVPELSCFVSPELPKGRDWFGELRNRLARARIGLMCLAPPNVAGEWQLIEAGAIWKAAKKGGLFPICFGIGDSEVPAPLREFQLTHVEQADFARLARGVVDASIGAEAWNDARGQAFDAAWPALRQAVEAALAAPDPAVRTPRGFLYEVAGGWWEHLIATDDTTSVSWMRVQRSDDGTRMSFNGDGYDEEGEPSATWHSEFVSIGDISATSAQVRYYWEGAHTRGSQRDFGGVGDLTFFIGKDFRVRTGKGRFTDVCLDRAHVPTRKLVELRRATAEETAVMEGDDAPARRRLLQHTCDTWSGGPADP